jgi:hypothetical protein
VGVEDTENDEEVDNYWKTYDKYKTSNQVSYGMRGRRNVFAHEHNVAFHSGGAEYRGMKWAYEAKLRDVEKSIEEDTSALSDTDAWEAHPPPSRPETPPSELPVIPAPGSEDTVVDENSDDDDDDDDIQSSSSEFEKDWLPSLNRFFFFRGIRFRAMYCAVAGRLLDLSSTFRDVADRLDETARHVWRFNQKRDEEWQARQLALSPFQEPLTAEAEAALWEQQPTLLTWCARYTMKTFRALKGGEAAKILRQAHDLEDG